jgi:hypothetical protein
MPGAWRGATRAGRSRRSAAGKRFDPAGERSSSTRHRHSMDSRAPPYTSRIGPRCAAVRTVEPATGGGFGERQADAGRDRRGRAP